MPSEDVEEKKNKKKTNLVDELRDVLLEPLHHVGQSLDLVTNMRTNGAL